MAMLDVLGLNPESEEWSSESASDNSDALAGVVEAVIAARNDARAHKNFDLADSLRDVLSEAGVDVVDTENGSEWSIRG
jgi:cysteinyl-tRNA synthetase